MKGFIFETGVNFICILILCSFCIVGCSSEENETPNLLNGYQGEIHTKSLKQTLFADFLHLITEENCLRPWDFPENMYDYLGCNKSEMKVNSSGHYTDSLVHVAFISNSKFKIISRSFSVKYNAGEVLDAISYGYKFNEGVYKESKNASYDEYIVTKSKVLGVKNLKNESILFNLDNYIQWVQVPDFENLSNRTNESYEMVLNYEIDGEYNILFWDDNIRMRGKIDIYSMELSLEQTYPFKGNKKTALWL